jgi:hypothetical protein
VLSWRSTHALAMAASPALEAALRLEAWLGRNGLAGFDPYDVRGTSLGVALQRLGARGGILRAPRRALAELDELAPMTVRRLLRVRPRENAHAVALIARAQAYLHETTGDDRHARVADDAVAWLLAHPSPGHPGLGWGYPFNWQTNVLIPADMPSAFVSVVAGDALLARGRVDEATRVADFLVNGLNVKRVAEGVSFSYTPVDDFQVNNVNLLVADYLTRVGALAGRDELTELGLGAATLTLAEFRDDGSLPYWRREQDWRNPGHLDHYHAGNALRALAGLLETTGENRFRETLDGAFAFYRGAFFAEAMPLTFPHATDPIDVHACAEALHATATLAPLIPEAGSLLQATLAWIVEAMQRTDGAFAYRIRHRFGVSRRSDVAFVRWGQAPMLVGLAAAAKVGA